MEYGVDKMKEGKGEGKAVNGTVIGEASLTQIFLVPFTEKQRQRKSMRTPLVLGRMT